MNLRSLAPLHEIGLTSLQVRWAQHTTPHQAFIHSANTPSDSFAVYPLLQAPKMDLSFSTVLHLVEFYKVESYTVCYYEQGCHKHLRIGLCAVQYNVGSIMKNTDLISVFHKLTCREPRCTFTQS